MTTKAIREKLLSYLQVASEKKLKAIYTMVEHEIDNPTEDWDDDFIMELDHRSKSVANGTVKTYSWDETKEGALKKIKFTSK